MKYIEMVRKEMEEVLEQLKPHFEEYGELYLKNKYINLKTENDIYNIIKFNFASINNVFNRIYDEISSIKREDIFEEVGNDLKELKIKQVLVFDIEQWKNEFAKRNNLGFDNGIVYRGYCKVIDEDNEINKANWHDYIFENKHKLFKFDCCSSIYLKTKDECDEFERVYKIMDKYLKSAPVLDKEK